MSLPSNLNYLLVQLKIIEQVDVVNCLLSEVRSLLICERIKAGLCIILSPTNVELLDNLIDFSVGERFGFFGKFGLHSKLIKLF